MAILQYTSPEKVQIIKILNFRSWDLCLYQSSLLFSIKLVKHPYMNGRVWLSSYIKLPDLGNKLYVFEHPGTRKVGDSALGVRHHYLRTLLDTGIGVMKGRLSKN